LAVEVLPTNIIENDCICFLNFENNILKGDAPAFTKLIYTFFKAERKTYRIFNFRSEISDPS
jgi:hypothetical protein